MKREIFKYMLFISLIASAFIFQGCGSSSGYSSGYSGSYSAPSSSSSSSGSESTLQKTDFPDVQCSGCNGKGYYIVSGQKFTCKQCNGSGKKTK